MTLQQIISSRDSVSRKAQKQQAEAFCKKRCSYKFRKFHWKTTVLDVFLIRLQTFRGATLWKRDSCTCVYSETRFLRKPTITEKTTRQIKEIKFNLTGPRTFDISLCVIFSCYCQSYFWKRDWALGSTSN